MIDDETLIVRGMVRILSKDHDVTSAIAAQGQGTRPLRIIVTEPAALPRAASLAGPRATITVLAHGALPPLDRLAVGQRVAQPLPQRALAHGGDAVLHGAQERAFDAAELTMIAVGDLLFAWVVAKHAASNAIVIARRVAQELDS